MNAGFNPQENAKGLTITRVNPEGLWNIPILPGLLIQESIPSVSAVRRMIILIHGTAHGAFELPHESRKNGCNFFPFNMPILIFTIEYHAVRGHRLWQSWQVMGRVSASCLLTRL
jgi:hypothetical protein